MILPGRTGGGQDGARALVTCVESVAPYALFGDASGSFLAGSIPVGEHSITATPFAGDSAIGNVGDPLEVDFTIVGGAQG